MEFSVKIITAMAKTPKKNWHIAGHMAVRSDFASLEGQNTVCQSCDVHTH